MRRSCSSRLRDEILVTRLKKMANTENQPPSARKPTAKGIGYNIEFAPESPPIPAPQCVTNYTMKPPLSQAELFAKQDLATKRRKESEQGRQERIQQTEEKIKKLDSKVRPFINALNEAQQATRKW